MKSDRNTIRILKPLRSRKARVALATLIAAYAVHFGLQVDEALVYAMVSLGAALILGIAHEDAGRSRTDAQAHCQCQRTERRLT